jgi:predicted RND superfamily exporter protein
MGTFTALGAILLLPVCLLLLPSILALVRPPRVLPKPPNEAPGQWLWRSLARLGTRHPLPVFAVWAVATVVAVFGSLRIQVCTNALEFLPEEHPLRVSEREIQSHLGASTVLNLVVSTGVEDGAIQPETLNRLAKLEAYAKSLPETDDTYSILDLLEPIKEAFDEGEEGRPRLDVGGRVLPATLQETAEYMFLYPYPGDFERVLSEDRSTLRLLLRLNKRDSSNLGRIQGLIERQAAEIGFPPETFHATSTLLLIGHSFDRISTSMIRSIILSFGFIFLAIIILTRSLRTGAIAMIPNALPTVFLLGFMGWLGYKLDLTNCTVAAITIGIAVDDTIHFLAKFRRQRGIGRASEPALRRTLQRAGPAILFSTGVLALSVSIFRFSDLKVIIYFGHIAAFGFVVCLLADLTLLPALLFQFGPQRWKGEGTKLPLDRRG